MLLLGITGRKGSGKNTVFDILDEWIVEQGRLAMGKGFADLLKLSACRIYYPDCTLEFALEWADKIKIVGDGEAFLFQESELNDDKFGELPQELQHITGRQLLQRYGTESHRDVFGENFWVDQLLPFGEWRGEQYWEDRFKVDDRKADIAVITDLRFPNEAERILELGGTIWEVVRPGRMDEMKDVHTSEKPLPRSKVDLLVNNAGSLDDLRKMVTGHCEGQLKVALEKGNWG